MARPISAAATFCATLVDEWVRAGVTSAFIAPGSRSTPLALALYDNQDIELHLFHDERSASFAALGHGLVTGSPGVVLCSSGTAGTHFHAAVVEADLSAVPLLVCTADRPPELIGVGAPQAIEQTNLYGPVVRLFAEPGVPDDATSSEWRLLGQTSAAAALGSTGMPGPVHLNLGFRDPLDGLPGPLPAELDDRGVLDHAQPMIDAAVIERLIALLDGKHGLVVAGAGISAPTAVVALADKLEWPLLADQRSGCDGQPGAVSFADLITRTRDFTSQHAPQVILRFGEQQSSKSLNSWLASCGATVIALTPHGRLIDPDRVATILLPDTGIAEALLAAELNVLPGDRAAWQHANDAANQAIRSFVDSNEASEIAVARSLVERSQPGANLVLSSSMPIRQVEWFGGPARDLTVFSNRGANGIDGVIATAIGVASTGQPTICFIGDVAFLHDATSLTALSSRQLDLTIVVVNNDGGGIFSYLPQSSNLDPAQFEALFGTPHHTDLAALARAHNLSVEPWRPTAVAAVSGIRVVVAPSTRSGALAQQADLVAMATAAIQASLQPETA